MMHNDGGLGGLSGLGGLIGLSKDGSVGFMKKEAKLLLVGELKGSKFNSGVFCIGCPLRTVDFHPMCSGRYECKHRVSVEFNNITKKHDVVCGHTASKAKR